MARDILGEFGPDSSQPQAPAAGSNVPTAKPIPYSPPVGPIQGGNSPGLGGSNHGTCGTQK